MPKGQDPIADLSAPEQRPKLRLRPRHYINVNCICTKHEFKESLELVEDAWKAKRASGLKVANAGLE